MVDKKSSVWIVWIFVAYVSVHTLCNSTDKTTGLLIYLYAIFVSGLKVLLTTD